jgi:hypothetical protein
MSRIGVLVAAAMAIAACRGGGDGAKEREKAKAADGETVSVTGVVTGVAPDKVQVKTDDGRELAFKMSDAVSVTLAGGESQSAVITEGAPVRVSYRPKGSGGDAVTIDVEPQATNGRGEAKGVPQRDPPADPSRARQGG